MFEVLSFSIVKNEHCAMRISNVSSVMLIPEITRMPEMKSYGVGMLSIRGKLVPIFDLNMLLNQTKTIDPEYLVFIEDGKTDLAILAVTVDKILTVTDDMILKNDMMNSVINSDNKLITLLDVHEIITKITFNG
jgi:chemotaxis signal transduction protein